MLINIVINSYYLAKGTVIHGVTLYSGQVSTFHPLKLMWYDSPNPFPFTKDHVTSAFGK
jgi:hypothetical protein